MTEVELAAIEKACADATPGPWVYVSEHTFVGRRNAQYECGAEDVGLDDGIREDSQANGWFMANARSWVPALMAEVLRLRAEVAAEREACAMVAEERGEVITADLIRARGKGA